MIRTFQSNERVEAVEFVDFASIQLIIQLTGMGITVAFGSNGSLQSLTLKNSTTVLVAAPGQFVYKNSTGTVGVCNYDYLQENYKEVTEPAAE
jgi:hypothetical protein